MRGTESGETLWFCSRILRAVCCRNQKISEYVPFTRVRVKINKGEVSLACIATSVEDEWARATRSNKRMVLTWSLWHKTGWQPFLTSCDHLWPAVTIQRSVLKVWLSNLLIAIWAIWKCSLAKEIISNLLFHIKFHARSQTDTFSWHLLQNLSNFRTFLEISPGSVEHDPPNSDGI